LEAFLDDLTRLGIALLLGAMIGVERQLAGQAAGLRTHVLVSMGAAVFTLAGLAATGAENPTDVSRVVQGVAAGVGFIGAGAIMRSDHDSNVRGLTTAGSIWVAAAMGTTAGLGEWALAAAAGCATLVVLVVLKPVSRWLSRRARP
jgi:putative Mg2+ transporter-C (MgtC) family protein